MIFDEEYVKARIDTSGGPDACWPWTGPINRILNRGFAAVGGERCWVPRYVYEVRCRRLPAHLRVYAVCGNSLCCNIAHLEVHRKNQRPVPQRKYLLTPNQVIYASHLWCSGTLRQNELAEHFGVSTGVIRNAVLGKDTRKSPICRRRRPAIFKKLNTEKVLEIRRQRKEGALLREIAEKHGVSISHISRIVRNLVLARVKERPTT